MPKEPTQTQKEFVRKLADEMFLGSMHSMCREGALKALRETVKAAIADPKALPALLSLWGEVLV